MSDEKWLMQVADVAAYVRSVPVLVSGVGCLSFVIDWQNLPSLFVRFANVYTSSQLRLARIKALQGVSNLSVTSVTVLADFRDFAGLRGSAPVGRRNHNIATKLAQGTCCMRFGIRNSCSGVAGVDQTRSPARASFRIAASRLVDSASGDAAPDRATRQNRAQSCVGQIFATVQLLCRRISVESG